MAEGGVYLERIDREQKNIVKVLRRWEHVIEDLEREEARYMKLMEF